MLDTNSCMSDKIKEEKGEANAILLAQVGESYWLVEGVEHLAALLSADQSYPTQHPFIAFGSPACSNCLHCPAGGWTPQTCGQFTPVLLIV